MFTRDPAVNLYTMIPAGNPDPKGRGSRCRASFHRYPYPMLAMPQSSVRPMDAGRFLRLRQLLYRGSQAKGKHPEAREFYVWDDPKRSGQR